MTTSIRMPCKYCPNGHVFVCDCSHSHGVHTFTGGCRICGCTGYSQKYQRVPGEDQVLFDKRVLAQQKKERKLHRYA